MAEYETHSNLKSFVDSITPSVRPRFAPKSCFNGLRSMCYPTAGKDMIEYYTLGDFWEPYYQWSACGARVPIRLKDGKTVVQFFSPTLSAIQIYTRKSSPRNGVEETDNLDLTDEYGSEKLWSSDSSASEETSYVREKEQLGDLHFQFADPNLPYNRIPLFDKVLELAKDCPGLIWLKSQELSPASWISVAWYPIYCIPSQSTTRELSACFLTYHSLNSSFRGSSPVDLRDNASYALAATRSSKRIFFIPFGLATLKMQKDFWMNPGTGDTGLLTYLLKGAESLMEAQNFKQKDYSFFRSRR